MRSWRWRRRRSCLSRSRTCRPGTGRQQRSCTARHSEADRLARGQGRPLGLRAHARVRHSASASAAEATRDVRVCLCGVGTCVWRASTALPGESPTGPVLPASTAWTKRCRVSRVQVSVGKGEERALCYLLRCSAWCSVSLGQCVPVELFPLTPPLSLSCLCFPISKQLAAIATPHEHLHRSAKGPASPSLGTSVWLAPQARRASVVLLVTCTCLQQTAAVW